MCRGRSGLWPGGDPELDTVQEKVHQPTAHTAAGNYRNYPNNVERCTTSLLPVVFTSILLDINIECIKYFSSNTIIILGGGHMEPEAGQSDDQSEMSTW